MLDTTEMPNSTKAISDRKNSARSEIGMTVLPSSGPDEIRRALFGQERRQLFGEIGGDDGTHGIMRQQCFAPARQLGVSRQQIGAGGGPHRVQLDEQRRI